MAREKHRRAHGELQKTATEPPATLTRLASAAISALERIWADAGEPVHQANALSNNGLPLGVLTDVHACRLNASTNDPLQCPVSPAALPDATSSEPDGPDLFQRLSPELRMSIFELVYANANIVAATRGGCTCGLEGQLAAHCDLHEYACAESMVLLKGTRGTRRYYGCYIEPESESSGSETSSVAPEELESGALQAPGSGGQVMSPINSLLFVNKQTYLEVSPHLYRNASFFFDDWMATVTFTKTVGHHSLKLIRKVEVFAGDDRGHSYKWMINTIVASMPNIEHLKIGFWENAWIRLDGYDLAEQKRCCGFEKALLRFSSLKCVRQIDVEILEVVDDMENVDNTMAEPQTWAVSPECHVTNKAVEKMIWTGDHRVLDRARRAVLEDTADVF